MGKVEMPHPAVSEEGLALPLTPPAELQHLGKQALQLIEPQSS